MDFERLISDDAANQRRLLSLRFSFPTLSLPHGPATMWSGGFATPCQCGQDVVSRPWLRGADSPTFLLPLQSVPRFATRRQGRKPLFRLMFPAIVSSSKAGLRDVRPRAEDREASARASAHGAKKSRLGRPGSRITLRGQSSSAFQSP